MRATANTGDHKRGQPQGLPLQHLAMSLFIAHYASPIGTLEITANDQFLLSILFLETERRPGTGQTPTPDISEPIILTINHLDAYFAGTLQHFDLPMALQGTAFQQKVWAELANIPYGQTISYLELARRLGDEKCIRAAGMANGRNPVTIFVPCHRVIGSSGQLVGYGGDLWRKAWLLRHEVEHGPKRTGELF